MYIYICIAQHVYIYIYICIAQTDGKDAMYVNTGFKMRSLGWIATFQPKNCDSDEDQLKNPEETGDVLGFDPSS